MKGRKQRIKEKKRKGGERQEKRIVMRVREGGIKWGNWERKNKETIRNGAERKYERMWMKIKENDVKRGN